VPAAGWRAWLVGAALFLGARLVVGLLGEPLHRLLLYAGVLGAFAISSRLQRVLPGVALSVLAIAAAAWGYSNRQALRDGHVTASDAIDGILVEATGIGPRGLARLADFPSPYQRYIEKIDARSSDINILAAHLASSCESADHLCETVTILRFVADEVAYRTDPEGGPDYIKNPQETLAANAGDCEDKTILLISLLQSLGNHTYMAFTSSHAYPWVCFEQELRDLWLDRIRGRPQEVAEQYMRALAPHGDAEEFRRLLAAAAGIEIDGRFCYPLEPTSAGSWIGVERAGEDTVLVDAATRKVVRLKAR
jgi:hypothetical protein